MILLFVLFTCVNGHVPVFDSTSDSYNIKDKSWGIYKEMKKDESFSVFLNVSKDTNISFSVNLAGSQDAGFHPSETYIKVTLTGHNASQIKCDPKFTGWGYNHSMSRMLHSNAVDQTVDIPQNYGKLYFEPFGVGMYRPIANCQGKVSVTDDKFEVKVKILKVVPKDDDETVDDVLRISIGAGMEEAFTFYEVISLPITISQTWIWDQYLVTFVLTQFIGVTAVVTFTWYIAENANHFEWVHWLAINLLIHNIFIYAVRICYVTIGTDDWDESNSLNIFMACLIHIIAPTIFALIVYADLKLDLDYRRDTPCNLGCTLVYTAHLIFFAYCFLLVIQTFWLATAVSVALIFMRIFYPQLKGTSYSQINVEPEQSGV